MVVICAGTTGYSAVSDLRYLFMRQKRLQGSHFASDWQAAAFNDLVLAARIDPCSTQTRLAARPDTARARRDATRQPIVRLK